jgi:hypothetical protein
MADDSLKPPLTRRIPGAARSGPRSTTRPVLPDALLKRMQAAVDAARATRDREQVQPGRALRGPAPLMQPETTTPETATPETATPSMPVQIWPPAQTSPPVTSPPVTSPPVTSRALPVQPPQRPTPGPTPRPISRPNPRMPRRRGPRVAGAAALAVILFTAGAVAATLWAHASGAAPHGTRPQNMPPHSTPLPSTPPRSSPPSSPPPKSQSPSPATVMANIAASWVASQVSHDDYVACDKAMCDALAAHGFPGRKLQLIRPNSSFPQHAQVVVVTPVLARQFGSTPTTKWAPAVLTRIGFGASAILIRIVSSKGAAAYGSALSKDVQQRKASAQHLLTSAHVKASAAARNDLVQGRVDARLIVVLTALAAVHPIEILGFGTTFAGASPGIPLRVADLAPNDAASRMKWSDYLRFLQKVLAAQPTTYRPQSAGLIHASSSKLVFQIEFSAPSPLLIVGP